MCLSYFHTFRAVQRDQDEELLHYSAKASVSKRRSSEESCSDDESSAPPLSTSDSEADSPEGVPNAESRDGNETTGQKQVDDGNSHIQPGDAAPDPSEVAEKRDVLQTDKVQLHGEQSTKPEADTTSVPIPAHGTGSNNVDGVLT